MVEEGVAGMSRDGVCGREEKGAYMVHKLGELKVCVHRGLETKWERREGKRGSDSIEADLVCVVVRPLI